MPAADRFSSTTTTTCAGVGNAAATGPMRVGTPTPRNQGALTTKANTAMTASQTTGLDRHRWASRCPRSRGTSPWVLAVQVLSEKEVGTIDTAQTLATSRSARRTQRQQRNRTET